MITFATAAVCAILVAVLDMPLFFLYSVGKVLDTLAYGKRDW